MLTSSAIRACAGHLPVGLGDDAVVELDHESARHVAQRLAGLDAQVAGTVEAGEMEPGGVS
jgi:hypothetical protein